MVEVQTNAIFYFTFGISRHENQNDKSKASDFSDRLITPNLNVLRDSETIGMERHRRAIKTLRVKMSRTGFGFDSSPHIYYRLAARRQRAAMLRDWPRLPKYRRSHLSARRVMRGGDDKGDKMPDKEVNYQVRT